MATQSTPQFFASRWNDEMPRFARVLRALPDEKLDYKPHDKCTPAGNLGWQIAIEAGKPRLADRHRGGESLGAARERRRELRRAAVSGFQRGDRVDVRAQCEGGRSEARKHRRVEVERPREVQH